MRNFTSQETAALLPFDRLIEALRVGFSEGCEVPVRHHHTIDVPGEAAATLLLMPSWHRAGRSSRYLGIKIVTVFPGNSMRHLPGLTSSYILYDAQTGLQLAMLDGNTITSRRTAAASALAAHYLARKDASKLLVLGAGRVASLIPDAYRAVRPLERVAIWNVNRAKAETLAESVDASGIAAEVVDDLEKAVAESDMISAATLATAPLIRGKWIRPGTHLDLIGSFTPTMREVDDETICQASVFVDTSEALHEAGDLVQPMKAGLFEAKQIRSDLAALCRTNQSARMNEGEITLYKAVGTALADLVAATMVYETSSSKL